MERFRGIFTPIELGLTGNDVEAVLDTSVLFAMLVYGIFAWRRTWESYGPRTRPPARRRRPTCDGGSLLPAMARLGPPDGACDRYAARSPQSSVKMVRSAASWSSLSVALTSASTP